MINLATEDGVPWDADPHTPTPWSEFAESGDWWIQARDADGNPVGDPICDANDMSTADMFFIITACNAHDTLVEACKAAVALIARLEDSWDYTTHEGQQLRAALAKAEPND